MRLTLGTLGSVCVLLLLLLAPPLARGAVGDRVAFFEPPQGGNGRAIEVQPGTRTGFYSTYIPTSSQDKIRRLDMRTQGALDPLDTDLEDTQPDQTFGALSWDPTTGTLVGSIFGAKSRIYRINPTSGTVALLFNATDTDATLTGADGVAVHAADGTIFVSADGVDRDTTRIYHFTAAGATIGDPVEVPFGNSGIAIDGDDMWLAEVRPQKRIHKYTKAGAATGVSFDATGFDEPEDLSVDTCSIEGKKVVWTHGASTGRGPMGAFEIGTSDNAGCPAAPGGGGSDPDPGGGGGGGGGGGSPRVTDPGAPAKIGVGGPGGGGGSGGGLLAGVPIPFDATSRLDPKGILFVYIWIFDDYRVNLLKPGATPERLPAKQAKGKVKHQYKCAGFYSPTVTVIDAAGNRKRIATKLTVAFPKSTRKRHGSLTVEPRLVRRGSVARIGIKTRRVKKKKAKKKAKKKNRKRKARAKRTRAFAAASRRRAAKRNKAKKKAKRATRVVRAVYTLDGKRIGTRRNARQTVRRRITRKGPHVLDILVRFSGPKGSKRIRTCFQLS